MLPALCRHWQARVRAMSMVGPPLALVPAQYPAPPPSAAKAEMGLLLLHWAQQAPPGFVTAACRQQRGRHGASQHQA